MGIYDGVPSANRMVVSREIPSFKWLNITGFMKAGKTRFLVELSKHLRVAIMDLEDGTKSYVGEFLRVSNMEEWRIRKAWLIANRNKIKPHILAIDPLNALEGFIINDYIDRYNIKAPNGSDITYIGDLAYGKGYAEIRNIFQEEIESLFQIAPIILTISHVKLSVLGEERKNISYLDMDYTGKVKQFIQAKADGHCLFLRSKKDGKPYLKVSWDNSDTDALSFNGMRMGDIYGEDGIPVVNTGDELQEYLLKKFGVSNEQDTNEEPVNQSTTAEQTSPAQRARARAVVSK